VFVCVRVVFVRARSCSFVRVRVVFVRVRVVFVRVRVVFVRVRVVFVRVRVVFVRVEPHRAHELIQKHTRRKYTHSHTPYLTPMQSPTILRAAVCDVLAAMIRSEYSTQLETNKKSNPKEESAERYASTISYTY